MKAASLFILMLLSTFAGLPSVMAQGTAFSQTALDGFNPNVEGPVFAISVQADGKIVIGGDFTMVGGTKPQLDRAAERGWQRGHCL